MERKERCNTLWSKHHHPGMIQCPSAWFASEWAPTQVLLFMWVFWGLNAACGVLFRLNLTWQRWQKQARKSKYEGRKKRKPRKHTCIQPTRDSYSVFKPTTTRTPQKLDFFNRKILVSDCLIWLKSLFYGCLKSQNNNFCALEHFTNPLFQKKTLTTICQK